jgi:hypothetical protein
MSQLSLEKKREVKTKQLKRVTFPEKQGSCTSAINPGNEADKR